MTYDIRRIERSELDEMYRLLDYVYRQLENKRLLSWTKEDTSWFEQALDEGSFILAAFAPDGTMAAMAMFYIPGDDPDNLGLELGLSPEDLKRVAHIEYAVVHPAHRGQHLQKILMEKAEKEPEALEHDILLATVDPENAASLITGLHSGYTIQMTKNMYGGKPRHILRKDLNPGS